MTNNNDITYQENGKVSHLIGLTFNEVVTNIKRIKNSSFYEGLTFNEVITNIKNINIGGRYLNNE